MLLWSLSKRRGSFHYANGADWPDLSKRPVFFVSRIRKTIPFTCLCVVVCKGQSGRLMYPFTADHGQCLSTNLLSASLRSVPSGSSSKLPQTITLFQLAIVVRSSVWKHTCGFLGASTTVSCPPAYSNTQMFRRNTKLIGTT